MQSANFFRVLARLSAALVVLHILLLWGAERRGTLLGFEPAHFWQTAILFFLTSIYFLAESHLARKEGVAVEEIVSIEERVSGGGFGTPQPAWRSPYVLSAAIVGAALLVAGFILSNGSRPGQSAARPAASPLASPAPQQAPDGQQPPEKVAASWGNTPILNKNAKVQMMEFGDFQCPFCGRFFSETFGQIKKQYIDTGKVAYQHRDYPLPFHQFAQKAHEASRCALEQSEKKYWELHDWLYLNQNTLEVDNIKKAAATLGLNAAKFNQCLDSGKHAEAVKKDVTEGTSYGVSGTPTFLINGERIVGAQPLSAFQQAIEKYLK